MRRLLGISLIGCVFAVPAYGAPPTPQQQQQQFKLASGPAAKILVKQEGWHRVTFAELRKAGFAVPRRTATLQLYAEGTQVRMRVTNTAIEFYGVPLDTLSTGRQTYWLVVGARPGLRIPRASSGAASGPLATATSETTITDPRDGYYAAVLNEEATNFFSVPVTPAVELKQTVSVNHPNPDATATLEVALHGYSALQHRVRIMVDERELGVATFKGQIHFVSRFTVDKGIFKDGKSVVGLRGTGGELDYTLVDFIKVTYHRLLIANDDVLDFTLPAGQRARVDGFGSRAVRVMDVTDPSAAVLLRAVVERSPRGFSASIGSASKPRHLVALVDGKALQPDAVLANRRSSLHAAYQRADLVIVTHRTFRSALAPLVAARKREGLKSVVVDVEDVYDEFGFGAHGPQAMKDFFTWTRAEWASAPRFALLVGDATSDPRGFLAKGDLDLVPTKFVDTAFLESASDDWLADFDNDGVPEIPLGRLPVRTLEQAKGVIAKLVRYGTGSKGSGRDMLLVSDSPKDYDFEAASQTLYGLIPSTWTTTEVKRAQGPNDAAVRSRVLSALNEGPSIVNFFGHGAYNIWTSGKILSSTDALTLQNDRLSLYVMMTCLNGYFVAPNDSIGLGEALLYNPAGGAVAVWSSTGETVPTDQIAMDQKALGTLFAEPETTLGEAMVSAKASVKDMDVRRTWVLFGDPTMRLH